MIMIVELARVVERIFLDNIGFVYLLPWGNFIFSFLYNYWWLRFGNWICHLIELSELYLAHNDSHVAQWKKRIVLEKGRICRQLHLHENSVYSKIISARDKHFLVAQKWTNAMSQNFSIGRYFCFTFFSEMSIAAENLPLPHRNAYRCFFFFEGK